jgi:MFS family permease
LGRLRRVGQTLAGVTRLDERVESLEAAAGPDLAEPPSLAARENAYEKFVWDNLKRNYLGNFVHGMLGMTGWRLVSAPTFLPAYLHAASGSSAIVGLGLALQQLGGVVTPIVGASQVEHRTRVLPSAMWMGGLGRLTILGMAACGWLLKGQALVNGLLVMMLLFGVFMGAQRVVFQVLMAKMIPTVRRGRLQAWRNATGGLVAALMAYAAGKYLIEPNLFGHGYPLTFLLAFVATSLGISFFRLTIREPVPPTIAPRVRLHERLRDFPRLLAADRNFALFLMVQMLATAGRIATPFYIIYVGQTIRLTGGTLGLLSLAFLGADTLSNIVWGYTGDKTGFRQVLLFSMMVWIAATVLLILVHATPAIMLAFFGLGAAQSGYQMATQTMVLEFGIRDEIPMRLGLSTTAEAVVATSVPLIGGVMADHLGFHAVFLASIGFLAAGLMLLPAMAEPRRARLA